MEQLSCCWFLRAPFAGSEQGFRGSLLTLCLCSGAEGEQPTTKFLYGGQISERTGVQFI